MEDERDPSSFDRVFGHNLRNLADFALRVSGGRAASARSVVSQQTIPGNSQLGRGRRRERAAFEWCAKKAHHRAPCGWICWSPPPRCGGARGVDGLRYRGCASTGRQRSSVHPGWFLPLRCRYQRRPTACKQASGKATASSLHDRSRKAPTFSTTSAR